MSRDYKIELPLESITRILNVQEQSRIKDTIRVVLRDAREEKLSGDQLYVWSLYFDMDVLRTPRVESRNDSCQLVTPVCVGELMAAQGVPTVVVIAIRIRLPEIQQGMTHRLAIGGVHVASDNDLRTSYASVNQRGALR